jgi:hypothetical protein
MFCLEEMKAGSNKSSGRNSSSGSKGLQWQPVDLGPWLFGTKW